MGDWVTAVDGVGRLPHRLGRGRAQVSRVDLPAGPAVRTRRVESSGHMFGNTQVAELVSHVVVPEPAVHDDGRPAAVRHVVSWQLLSEGDDLAELADQCATLLRMERHAD